VFVIGNPGSTTRLYTVAQLEFNRDYTYRAALAALKSQNRSINSTSRRILTNSRSFKPDLRPGEFPEAYRRAGEGLFDPITMAKKRDFEQTLKDKVMANPEQKAKYGSIWDDIAR